MRCKVCSPTSCKTAFLYVVHDAERNAVKIGMSVKVSARMKSYRSNGADWIVLKHSRRAGCEWSASRREDAAIRDLARKLRPLQGDWFHCGVTGLFDAINAVEAACRGIKAEVSK